jgi:hypothetical protein
MAGRVCSACAGVRTRVPPSSVCVCGWKEQGADYTFRLTQDLHCRCVACIRTLSCWRRWLECELLGSITCWMCRAETETYATPRGGEKHWPSVALVMWKEQQSGDVSVARYAMVERSGRWFFCLLLSQSAALLETDKVQCEYGGPHTVRLITD